MTRPSVRSRRAFTLIELLIVIGIIVVLATLGAMFLPNLDRNKGVPNAATQIEGYVRLAKNQALRDGAPRGIRLIPDPNDIRRVTAIQYIEQPEPLAPRGVAPNGMKIGLLISTPNPNAPNPPPYPPPPGIVATATLVLIDPATNQPFAGNNWDDPASPQIFAGDFLELTGSPTVVARLMTDPAPAAGAPRAAFMLDRAIDGTDTNPLLLTDGFRVIRSPRPLAGEPVVQLHRDVFIDLTRCNPCPPPIPPAGDTNGYASSVSWSPTGNLDILFNSSGQVANAPGGQIILSVQHVDRPNDRLLVVIYTRTGKVSAVNWWDVTNNDPYMLARDGRGSGL